MVDGPRERWKPSAKVLKAVIQYVKDTKRFQLRATVIEAIQIAEDAGMAEEAGMEEEAGKQRKQDLWRQEREMMT